MVRNVTIFFTIFARPPHSHGFVGQSSKRQFETHSGEYSFQKDETGTDDFLMINISFIDSGFILHLVMLNNMSFVLIECIQYTRFYKRHDASERLFFDFPQASRL